MFSYTHPPHGCTPRDLSPLGFCPVMCPPRMCMCVCDCVCYEVFFSCTRPPIIGGDGRKITILGRIYARIFLAKLTLTGCCCSDTPASHPTRQSDGHHTGMRTQHRIQPRENMCSLWGGRRGGGTPVVRYFLNGCDGFHAKFWQNGYCFKN